MGIFDQIILLLSDYQQIKVIDFDWSGKCGVTKYPYFMNHFQIEWPPGASDNLIIKKEHDLWWVENL